MTWLGQIFDLGDKTWLETHIWHAKRMKMENILTRILWRPTCPFNEDPVGSLFQKPSDAAQPASEEATSKRKRKGKKKASDQNVDSKWPPNRTVWIRVHPAVTSEVHVALRTAASFALDTLGKITGRPECKVDIADLRGGVNVFEIMGPKSSQVIKGALKPVQHKWRGDFNKFWQALDQVQTTGSLPRGMVIGFAVQDPRLDPWRADWEVVLGLEDPPSPETDFISAQRETPVPPTEQAAEKKVRPWLLRGVGVPAMLQNLSSMFNPGAGLLDFINQARVKRGLDPLKTGTRTDELWQSALITVRVILCGRGNPEDLAMIYALDDAEAKKWHDAEARRQQGATSLLDEGEDDTQSSTSLPAPKSIIGYVTTGHYSLARGTGHAVGAIPVRQLFELWQQAERLHTGSSWLVKIRDRGDNICRVARIEMLGD
ncbi:predicted protein [Postia placenta Mad-698-R]|nr:predicted protein [Postia placenta Mad-698-R]